jgi:hypothetical protein
LIQQLDGILCVKNGSITLPPPRMILVEGSKEEIISAVGLIK